MGNLAHESHTANLAKLGRNTAALQVLLVLTDAFIPSVVIAQVYRVLLGGYKVAV